MEFETLETERTYLKKLTPESFKELFQNHSEETVMELLGLENHEEFLIEKEKSRGGYTTYDRSILAFLIVSKASNKTIGRCGFHNWYSDHKKAEIGYVIFKETDRNQGYLNEVLTVVLDYGFHVMNLNRIEACTSPNNAASLHLIRKNGFIQEGHLRQHFVRNGEIEDTFIFSLLKEDFEKLST